MHIPTINDVPGYKVTSVLDELEGTTRNPQLSRDDMVNRTVDEGVNWAETCTHGTAVVIEPIG